MNIRGSELYISHRTQWLLCHIAKSINGDGAATGDVATTPDKLAEDILTQWVKANKPKLLELYDQREAIEVKAQELLKEKP